ncbi:hypothetical protein G6F62_010684 [Rhizopus arrhizus]|nr:hypothetical protein G6F62_010684 [Rhizopus arrhizus]
MSQFIIEDDKGEMLNENGNKVSVLPMEVDDPNFPLGDVTNYSGEKDEYPSKTAWNWNKKGEEALDDFFEKRKPGGGRSVGRSLKLTDAHRDYIVKLVDENDTGLTLDQMMESLTTEFMELQIFKSAFHEFARTKCRISCKRAHFQPEERNSPQKVQERYDWVINLDVMDRHEEFKGHYFVMDNAPIHKHKDIKLYVESRGYDYVHLPPYSPELNPIEQFWSICKSKLKREALLQEETLTSRIKDACNSVLIDDLKGFCRYSQKKFNDCLEHKPKQ